MMYLLFYISVLFVMFCEKNPVLYRNRSVVHRRALHILKKYVVFGKTYTNKYGVLQGVAVCCSVLQCVAVCCSLFLARLLQQVLLAMFCENTPIICSVKIPPFCMETVLFCIKEHCMFQENPQHDAFFCFWSQRALYIASLHGNVYVHYCFK